MNRGEAPELGRVDGGCDYFSTFITSHDVIDLSAQAESSDPTKRQAAIDELRRIAQDETFPDSRRFALQELGKLSID